MWRHLSDLCDNTFSSSATCSKTKNWILYEINFLTIFADTLTIVVSPYMEQNVTFKTKVFHCYYLEAFWRQSEGKIFWRHDKSKGVAFCMHCLLCCIKAVHSELECIASNFKDITFRIWMHCLLYALLSQTEGNSFRFWTCCLHNI